MDKFTKSRLWFTISVVCNVMLGILSPTLYVHFNGQNETSNDINTVIQDTTNNANNANKMNFKSSIGLFLESFKKWYVIFTTVYGLINQYWWISQFIVCWAFQYFVKLLWNKLYQRLTVGDVVSKPLIFSNGMNVYKWIGEFEKIFRRKQDQ